mmetsp:Transcript_5615/g.8389  ORF Transcript_5615/g.8389 Transcript_5615/m.8389 type:complete len:135 (+) Transcript_5615:215-619(+)
MKEITNAQAIASFSKAIALDSSSTSNQLARYDQPSDVSRAYFNKSDSRIPLITLRQDSFDKIGTDAFFVDCFAAVAKDEMNRNWEEAIFKTESLSSLLQSRNKAGSDVVQLLTEDDNHTADMGNELSCSGMDDN